MSDRRTRMLEDKYLRESARALVEADIADFEGDAVVVSTSRKLEGSSSLGGSFPLFRRAI